MQQVAALDAEPGGRLEQGMEVAGRRLVRPDILRRDDRIEADPQLQVAGLERLPVDVRQDDQLVA